MRKKTDTSTFTSAEEDYIKCIYLIEIITNQAVTTNELAEKIKTAPASVTDMIRKLSDKGFVEYVKYYGVKLTESGRKKALLIIRSQRLWEFFLVTKLKFAWDEVGEVAEQLEHVMSPTLIAKLDEFLGFPKFDPHGDPIPDENGVITERNAIELFKANVGTTLELAAVLVHTPEFLKFLDRLNLSIGKKFTIVEFIPFDESCIINIDNKEIIISKNITASLLVVEKK